MPGLAGVVDLKEPGQAPILLDRLARVMTHHDWYAIDRFTSSLHQAAFCRVSLGIMNPEQQPVVSEDRSRYVFIDGEIYGHTSLKKRLKSEGFRFRIGNDPELVLGLIEKLGEQYLPQLNGSFSIAIWDEKTSTLKLINDRYGLRPLYFAHHDGRLLFASEAKALLEDQGTNREIDNFAASQLFTFGHLLDNLSIFQGVKMLPPGCVLTYENNHVRIREYWDFSFDSSPSTRPLEWYQEGLAHLLPQAINRQLERGYKTCVSLSGGLDSRTVLGCIDRKYYPVHTFTFGDTSECGDVQIANDVAKRLGTVHHFIRLPEDYLLKTARDIAYLTDGLMCMHFSGMGALPQMRAASQVIFQGTVGDVMFGGSYLNPQLGAVRNDTEFCNLLYKLRRNNFTEDYFSRVFRPEWAHEFAGLAFESLRDVLARFEEPDYFNRSDHFYLRNRLPRFNLLGLRVAHSQLEYQVPFFDNDLIEFYQQIPSELRRNSVLYCKTLKSLLPHLATVPWQKTGLPLQASRARRQLQFLKKKSQRLFSRGLQQFLQIQWTPQADRYFIDVPGWIKRNKPTQRFLKEMLLGPEAMSSPYLHQDGVRRILHEQFSGRHDHRKLIGRLLTFELAHQLFLK